MKLTQIAHQLSESHANRQELGESRQPLVIPNGEATMVVIVKSYEERENTLGCSLLPL
jgi:hypothetical protein